MLGNMRCTNMTPSDLWKTDIKANSQMSHPPPTPSHSFPAEIWERKGAESPSAIKRKVKCFTFLVRFWKWSHLKAICIYWNLTCHRYRELSLHGASADGDRHPSSVAVMNTTWCLAALLNRMFHLWSAETCSCGARRAFCSLIAVIWN